jgi:hypothetical protein
MSFDCKLLQLIVFVYFHFCIHVYAGQKSFDKILCQRVFGWGEVGKREEQRWRGYNMFFFFFNKDEGEKGFEKIWRIIYRHMV